MLRKMIMMMNWKPMFNYNSIFNIYNKPYELTVISILIRLIS